MECNQHVTRLTIVKLKIGLFSYVQHALLLLSNNYLHELLIIRIYANTYRYLLSLNFSLSFQVVSSDTLNFVALFLFIANVSSLNLNLYTNHNLNSSYFFAYFNGNLISKIDVLFGKGLTFLASNFAGCQKQQVYMHFCCSEIFVFF